MTQLRMSRSMTIRLGAIVAVAGGFLLTLVLLWPRADREAPAVEGAAMTSGASPNKDPIPWAHVQFKHSNEQPAASRSNSIGPAGKVRDVRSAEHDSPSAAPDLLPYIVPQTEVPVVLQWESSADKTEKNAVLHNMSSEPLHVSVTAENPATGDSSTVVVTLDGHSKANLADAGLVYEQGDQITVQSASQPDRIAK
jgi:hypothetical protein